MSGFCINFNENFGESMVIMYDSLTGNTARFIHKLPFESIKITDDMIVDQEFVLVTFTTGLGSVPETTLTFLKRNNQYLRGISSGGNKNFGTNFAVAADDISKMYNVPIISKFELAGTPTDVDIFLKGLNKIETH